MKRTIRGALIAMALLSACGSDQSSQAAVPQAQSPNQNVPSSAPPRYEVHEWGLASGAMGGGAVRLSTLPAPPPPAMSTRAPILYVRLLDQASVTFTATVEIPNGSIDEHWPGGSAIENGVRWTDVRAEPNGCSGTYPAEGGPECARVADGHCESARLRTLEASDAACLTVGGQAYNHLFYRGSPGSPTLPLSIQRGERGALVVTNRGGAPVGGLVRVLRGPTGTFVTMSPIPEAGQSTTVALPTSADELDRARRSIGDGLRQLGMTDQETQAFERAWLSELFDPMNRAAREATRRGPIRQTSDALLYWLPEASADELARLSFDPPPEAVRRAFLVRIVLGV